MNAIMFILKTGCQWRMLPRTFRPTIPSSTTSASGNMKACLRNWWIRSIGWSASWWAGGPLGLGIIDSRSVKSSHHVDTDRGIDGDKRIKGRKEHIVFDILGLPIAWWFTRWMSMTVSMRMALLTRWRAAFPDWKRCWRTADTKDGNWPIPYAKSSVRSLPLFSVRTSLRRNSPCCHSDVLWSALSPGWKTFEELPLITSSIPIRARRWFSSPSADSCITNYATEI